MIPIQRQGDETLEAFLNREPAREIHYVLGGANDDVYLAGVSFYPNRVLNPPAEKRPEYEYLSGQIDAKQVLEYAAEPAGWIPTMAREALAALRKEFN